MTPATIDKSGCNAVETNQSIKHTLLRDHFSVYKRLLTDFGFVDFGDYFGRFSVCFWGVIYIWSILPPKNKPKIGSKEPQNRQKRNPLTVSKEGINENFIFCLVLENKNVLQ